jgi:prevent-host-death family protein
MVSFISMRELSKQPGQVLKQVRTKGPQVITQNGTPAAYLIPASGQGIEADLDAVRRLLLGRALDAAQAEAARSGASELTEVEIAAEIAAARGDRRKRKSTKTARK